MINVDYIVPTWNSDAALDLTLSSIEKHGNPNQIIIVDRCSQDKTLDIARKHRCKIIKFNGSLGAARLLGAEAAQTEFIGFVDSDVELTGDWKYILFYASKNEYEDAGVYGAYYQGSLNNSEWPMALDGKCWAFGCIITRRSDLLDCTELEGFSSAEDGAYARFLSGKGLKWYVFPVAVIHHQDLSIISQYMRWRWLGAGLRKRDGFQLVNVKRILGGALFGIKINNSNVSYTENWRIRMNYFIGYINNNKYFEPDRSKN